MGLGRVVGVWVRVCTPLFAPLRWLRVATHAHELSNTQPPLKHGPVIFSEWSISQPGKLKKSIFAKLVS